MGDQDIEYYNTFERPGNKGISLQKRKSKKRALQDRLYEESPTKKAKKAPRKRPFGAEPPPPDDVTNEDSSLMDLFNLKNSVNFSNTNTNPAVGDRTPSSLSTSPSPSSTISSMSPLRHSISNVSCNSPISTYYNNTQSQSNGHIFPQPQPKGNYNITQTQSYIDFIQTPPQTKTKKRQQLTPAPLTASPSWPNQITGSNGIKSGSKGVLAKNKSSARTNLTEKFAAEDEWSQNPCLDWSLKTRLTLVSSKPFGWNSTGLKSSEESSGTSAFARCIDINPKSKEMDEGTPQGSQLDTSIGAQFHQCCLYWQHPSLPMANLFPRESSQLSFTPVTPSLNGIRMEQKVYDCMLTEWIEAFRSLFQLLRTRQCPYFYICANQFTVLFCAAGTQGLDYLQVYVTPSSKGFRDSLRKEGIEFSTPCSLEEDKAEQKCDKISEKNKKTDDKDGNESDGDADQWLDEMGISQDVSLTVNAKNSPASTTEEKNKSTLVFIAGANTLAFFNFLINSKNLLVSSSGPFAGLPPTLLSPIAFHGATLRTLKVKQSKGKNANGEIGYSIDMTGPILPHVIPMICPVLKKTVQDFKILASTLNSTINLNSRMKSAKDKTAKANAFELQNLSDCGLSRTILELFCRPGSIDTIIAQIECQDNMYKWS